VVISRELGVIYPLRPFAGLATGLYVDQRATRAWLRPLAAGKRVLNLFSNTGAFSLNALHAGAVAATDIDLSAVALTRAKEGAALNGVAERMRTLHGDCREVLAALSESERFDIIIIDPPTAAQGAGGWVLRRDYGQVLRLALARLAPGGILVACCNTIGGKPFDLAGTIQEQAGQVRILLRRIDGPPLGEDLPQLDGFPEGRPFRLVAMRATAAG
jgi:23S rRNA (cytosine1962-C5)-methyltransferase